MKARFPFTKIGKTYLGSVHRPYARIEISSDKVGDWVPIEAVVDTGADYTLLPRRYAFLGRLKCLEIFELIFKNRTTIFKRD